MRVAGPFRRIVSCYGLCFTFHVICIIYVVLILIKMSESVICNIRFVDDVTVICCIFYTSIWTKNYLYGLEFKSKLYLWMKFGSTLNGSHSKTILINIAMWGYTLFNIRDMPVGFIMILSSVSRNPHHQNHIGWCSGYGLGCFLASTLYYFLFMFIYDALHQG